MKLPVCAVVLLLAGCVTASADTLDDKLQGLKDAVASKNAPQVKQLALETFPLVSETLRQPAPEDSTQKEAWTSRVQYVKTIQLYAEYALVAVASTSPPATMVDLVGTLEQQNPKSQYLDAAYGPYLVAVAQTGSTAKSVAIAEKALANFPQNEDLLLCLANAALARKQNDRALSYANRLVAVLASHAKPEGITAAQWERKRNGALGRGYWIAGVINGEQGRYQAADKNLRPALPLIQGDEPMMAAALFHLGVANYQLGRMTLNKGRILEGAKYSEQCAALSSPYSDQALHNALVMKNEAGRMR